MDRRVFLRLAGLAAAAPVGALLGACGNPPVKRRRRAPAAQAGTPAAGGSTNRKVRLGFIALTDCASIVMAKELGYFAERGLDVSVEKHGGHVLSSMPLSVGTGIGGTGARSLRVAMNLNNNGQAITLSKDYAGVGYGDPTRSAPPSPARRPRWPARSPGALTIPPPQVVANMKVEAMDGFCVGEPWGAQAVAQNIGFTHINTQDIWRHHPEQALVVTEKFATERPDVLMDLMGAVLKASKWLDDLANRKKAAETISAASYVNAPASEIEGRMLGQYDLGANIGHKTYTDDYMSFFRGGQVNSPRRGYAIWFMSQYPPRSRRRRDAPPPHGSQVPGGVERMRPSSVPPAPSAVKVVTGFDVKPRRTGRPGPPPRPVPGTPRRPPPPGRRAPVLCAPRRGPASGRPSRTASSSSRSR